MKVIVHWGLDIWIGYVNNLLCTTKFSELINEMQPVKLIG